MSLDSLSIALWNPAIAAPSYVQYQSMPALDRALALCLLASMHARAYEPLTRRRIAELAAATTLAPRISRADEPRRRR